MPKTLGTRKEHLNSDEGGRTMSKTLGMRWLVVAAGAAMLLVLGAACAEKVEVPGETVVVEKEVVKIVEVPGETVIKEVPGETIIKEVMVPGETVTVTKEVIKEVMVPGETVVVEKVVIKEVEVPGETITVTKEVIKEVMVPGETVVVTKEVIKTVAGPERVVIKEVRAGYVTDPTTGKVVSAPEYGGTLTLVRASMRTESTSVWHDGGVVGYLFLSPVLEKPAIGNWAIDREEHGWNTAAVPLWALKGALAESWEISPDGLTYTFPIRKGVNWHNKAPMNGRELTADDIEWNFHRYYGLGSGFTEPSPHFKGVLSAIPFESITATDKWTVVLKLKEPRLFAMNDIVDMYMGYMYPPEVIKEHGDAKDWRNLVGTGPYEMTALVSGTSVTYTKNPDYWAYDEKYPENRLPYIDELRLVFMQEQATRLAAMRAGKLDYMGVNGNAAIASVDQLESLQRTNPEIVLWKFPARSDSAFGLNVNKPPFDDINVRRAMQMALDLETINATYWKGYGSTKPQGMYSDDMKGWVIPFEEWPEEVKKVHTYDPEGAKALLDAAGYEPDADGIRFKTVMIHYVNHDATFSELAAAYWGEIGVDVEVQVTPSPEFGSKKREGLFEMLSATKSYKASNPNPGMFWSGSPHNPSAVKDPDYDAIYDAYYAADTIEEAQRLQKEADMYAEERHWTIWGAEVPKWNVTQPWVIGYNGEIWLGMGVQDSFFARLWIDSELKEAMGR